MGYIIRPVEADDVKEVYEFIAALAKQESLTSRFHLTESSLREELFSSQSDWHGVVAVDNSKVIGICLYSFANTNREFNPTPLVHIDVLFVDPDHRQKKVADSLCREVVKIGQERGYGRIELWVTRNNNIAMNFYKSLGASVIDTINVLRINI